MSPLAMASLFMQTYAYYLDCGKRDGHVRELWGELVRTLCRLTKRPCVPALTLSPRTAMLVDLTVSIDMSTSLLLLMGGLGCVNAHLIYGQLLPGTQYRELYSLVMVCSTFAVDQESMAKIQRVIAQIPQVEPRASIIFDSRHLALLRFQVRKLSLRSTILEKAQEESIQHLRAIYQVTLQDAISEDANACVPLPVAVVGTGIPMLVQTSPSQEVRLRDPTGIVNDVSESHEVPCVHNFLPRRVLDLSPSVKNYGITRTTVV